MLIGAATLQAYVRDVFVHEGCPAPESERIGRYLVAANLAGHDSHGVIRVPRYIAWLEDGTLRAGLEPELVSDSGAFALLDAHYGFGQSAGPVAVELGLRKARQHGAAIVALRHAGHLGRIGEWAEQAAEAGLVSVHFVNVAGSLLVAPFGAVDRRFSTAPFAAGLPVSGRPPIILDFATSLVAEGKVLVASQGGKPLPAGSLIGPDGEPSQDPSLLYGPLDDSPVRDHRKGLGAIRAFGDHKGSGLALMCELLAGALTGSGCAGPPPRRVCNGMLSIYLTPELFGSADAFAAEMRGYLDFLSTARPAKAGEPVLLPGEPERLSRTRRLAEGVPLTDAVWAALTASGVRHGLDAEQYRAS